MSAADRTKDDRTRPCILKSESSFSSMYSGV